MEHAADSVYGGPQDEQIASSARPQASTQPNSIVLPYGIHRDSFHGWSIDARRALARVLNDMEDYPNRSPATPTDRVVRPLPSAYRLLIEANTEQNNNIWNGSGTGAPENLNNLDLVPNAYNAGDTLGGTASERGFPTRQNGHGHPHGNFGQVARGHAMDDSGYTPSGLDQPSSGHNASFGGIADLLDPPSMTAHSPFDWSFRGNMQNPATGNNQLGRGVAQGADNLNAFPARAPQHGFVSNGQNGLVMGQDATMDDIDDGGADAEQNAAPGGATARAPHIPCTHQTCPKMFSDEQALSRHLKERHVGRTCYFILPGDGGFCGWTSNDPDINKAETRMILHMTNTHAGRSRAADTTDADGNPRWSCPFDGLCKKTHTAAQEACRCMRKHQTGLREVDNAGRQVVLRNTLQARAQSLARAQAQGQTQVQAAAVAPAPAPAPATTQY
ncbi:hypothetical protein SLS62_000276 [Diatrype stigma]|uniref:C2H2-type domain-containing protein n=1 Tax=Diatrype stigma TaxID=117547 RepID=A0AAN9VD15_9PEZI